MVFPTKSLSLPEGGPEATTPVKQLIWPQTGNARVRIAGDDEVYDVFEAKNNGIFSFNPHTLTFSSSDWKSDRTISAVVYEGERNSR